VLDVTATENVFLGDSAMAWLRLRSPRPADELRGVLHWRGADNSYLGMTTLWAVESTAAGGYSEQLDWDGWMESRAREETGAARASAMLAGLPDGTLPVWQRTRRHFQPVLSDTAPEAVVRPGRGADLTQIPAPPHERTGE
jgi:hypothetical protein